MAIPWSLPRKNREPEVAPSVVATDWAFHPFVHPDLRVREKDLVRDAFALAKELHGLSSVLPRAVSDKVVILLNSAEKYERCFLEAEPDAQEKVA